MRSLVSGLFLGDLAAQAESPLEPRFLEPTARPPPAMIDHAITAGMIARSFVAANPLLPQAGRRRWPLTRAKPIFFLCRDDPSTVITRRVTRGAGGALCCDDGGRYQLLPVSAETSPRFTYSHSRID
jgi:hypothetical protein